MANCLLLKARQRFSAIQTITLRYSLHKPHTQISPVLFFSVHATSTFIYIGICI